MEENYRAATCSLEPMPSASFDLWASLTIDKASMNDRLKIICNLLRPKHASSHSIWVVSAGKKQ